MKIDTQQFHATFFDEAAEHLAVMEENLLLLEENPREHEVINNIFRSAHSIKGSGATFGFSEISSFTHGLENLLDRMRDGSVIPNKDMVGLLLQSTDHLGSLLTAAKDGGSYPQDELQLQEKITSYCASSVEVASDVRSTVVLSNSRRVCEVYFKPDPQIFFQGMDPLLLVQEVVELGEESRVELISDDLPLDNSFNPEQCYLRWRIECPTDVTLDELKSVFVFIDDTSEVIITERAATVTETNESVEHEASTPGLKATNSIETSSIRVAIDKVDELINLVGELVISQSIVNQVLSKALVEQIPGSQEAMTLLERSTRDIQERVMAIRMVPLASVFRRIPRLVRDLANVMDKRVQVNIEGEDTEIDKQMIESIADPLIHLIRNSVDHGIESPEKRLKSGKSELGTVHVAASHEGGNVVIKISDDGAGLNTERIRAKAISSGLIAEEDSLSDEQIHSLIFAPGFSTAETVSDISGRGVGMDVVKRNVEALNGSISIESRAGLGSTFTVRLPLTLAIVEGLSICLEDEIYILPLLSVVESISPTKEQIKRITGNVEVIQVRGEVLPLVRLHRFFNRPARHTDPTAGIVVIVECGAGRLALLVDKLMGQSHAVMKSLEANYQKVDGIAGATILGDGQVAFVLDVSALNRHAHSKGI